jgi:hypothetical protein
MVIEKVISRPWEELADIGAAQHPQSEAEEAVAFLSRRRCAASVIIIHAP